MDVLLSIGMIVKNEARCLEKCLKALEPLRRAVPCELVIADTGSTDGTRQIAEKYADILFDFPWVNDFSAARNAVMDRCSGKWYLTVDADEYLDPNIEDFLNLLLYQREEEWPEAALINQRNYLYPEMQYSAYSDFLALRMVRLGIGIHYEGTIHEALKKKSDGIHVDQIKYLSRAILHHDGYALQSEEAQEAKLKRNLDLLDKELQKHPDDIFRLGQCIESASKFPNKLIAYVVRSVDVLHQAKKTALENPVSPVVASHCALIAVTQHLSQAREWIQWSKDHYPSHIATKLDTVYAEILLEYLGDQYERIPDLADQYLQAFEQYQKKEVPVVELATSVLRAAEPTHCYRVKAIASIALANLGQYKESLDSLLDWPLTTLAGENLQDWTKALIFHCDNPDAQAAMGHALKEIESHYTELKFSPWIKNQHDSFQSICQQLFLKKTTENNIGPKEPWRILLAADGSFGLAARILSSTDEHEITHLLSEVKDWSIFPPRALEYVYQSGIAFPNSISQQSSEWLQDIIFAVSEDCEDFGALLLSWIKNNNFDSLCQTQLLYWMLIAALTQKETFSHKEVAIQLCQHYTQTAEKYLNHIYHPDVLDCDSVCCAFNQMDRFSIDYLKANSALARGDQRAFIHTLRLGLRIAPQMKEFVEYLLHNEKNSMRTKASPELLALAEKVRSILAQYPSDDPAVMALKKSEAYRKVAYLIDNIEES